jgi:hypothetical protein
MGTLDIAQQPKVGVASHQVMKRKKKQQQLLAVMYTAAKHKLRVIAARWWS